VGETPTSMPHARTFALRTALAAVVAALAITAPAAQAGSAGCPNADARPGQASSQAFRSSTLCLLNRERSARGMRRLRQNRRLASAARGHATDMVRRDYFAHNSLNGSNPKDRIRRAGYLKRARKWVVGENLAWGTGSRGTPREIVVAWMNSPSHRVNILKRRFREVGIGIVGGAPTSSPRPAATYTTDFGARR
jgi:uncharacterized protein YkwD